MSSVLYAEGRWRKPDSMPFSTFRISGGSSLQQNDRYREDHANILDPKTLSLVNIGIMAALGLEQGLPLQIALARDAGALRDEIISAMMVGLPGYKEEIMGSYDRST